MLREVSASVVAALVVGLTAASGLVAGAPPASAHASGELPTAQLRADGALVHVDISAAPDDAAVIGTALGYLDEGAMRALLGDPDEALPTAAQVEALSSSAELRDYLEAHVSVIQDGQPCSGEAFPAADFLAEGARLEFRCERHVEQAQVRITLLHDEDPAYRTFSVDGTEQYAIHSAAAPQHDWDFTRSSQTGIDPILLGGVIVVVIGSIVVVVAVRPGRRPRGGA